MNNVRNYNVCKNLILSDLLVFKKNLFDKFINLTIWVVLTVFVMGYIMPYFGLPDSFGVFQLGGILAAVALFELYGSITEFVADLQGDRVIDYHLTLPIPSWLAIVSKAIYYFIIYLALSIMMLPIGKLTLWNQLDLAQINYLKLFLALIFQSIFGACFTIWASTMIDNMSQMNNVWMRYIFPMWFMGGFQFSWKSVYHVLPIVAWINLINPMIYNTESVRVALLGQDDYLNFWLCIMAISLFSVIFMTIGMSNLKKKLDYV